VKPYNLGQENGGLDKDTGKVEEKKESFNLNKGTFTKKVAAKRVDPNYILNTNEEPAYSK
jgi:hypothetical protein